MIQQVCLSEAKAKIEVNFDEPIELVFNVKDYNKFEKIITVLFDQESVERIRKVKSRLD
jgi:hypothetical protein